MKKKLSILKTIVMKLKGHDCEKMVKLIGNETTLTLPTVIVELAKINIRLFSNKVMEVVRATTIVVT